ncbi:hypothetical protein [Priestia megaterium]|uniref:hypothetical protein n=1 Tax=Priestia megaterium TaxID=1404 RepID=UPI00211C40E3|nr:hypothetical protein [Priestia megaterium]
MMEKARMKIEDAVTTWKRSNNGLIRIHIEGKESIRINSFIQQRAASTIKLLLTIEAFRQIDAGILAFLSFKEWKKTRLAEQAYLKLFGS